MRSRWLYGVLVLVALVWWLAFERPSAPAAVAVDRDPGAAAAAEAASAVEVASVPGGQPPRAQETVAPKPSPTAVPQETAPEKRAAAPIPPDTRGFVDALAERYEADARSANAGEDELWLRRLFAEAGSPPDMLRSATCRQSICKLELRWTAQHDAPYRRVMDEFGAVNAKFLATRADEPDASGAVLVDAYVVRTARR